MKTFRILAIETSCDETAASVVEATLDTRQQIKNIKILSNIIASQIKIHQKYGGVFPELASRAHCEKIIPVIEEALKKAGIQSELVEQKWVASATGRPKAAPVKRTSFADKRAKALDAIATTTGPGLIGSLLIGVETAKALAYAWDKPIIPVNHLEGHIYSAIGGVNSKFPPASLREALRAGKIPNSKFFPALALVVSGGHTSLVLMTDHLKYQTIGETLDDAAGEAFDKVAQILGLGYPGGPLIERTAQEFEIKNQKSKCKMKIQNSKLPRPMIESNDFNFSFSGLKTAVLYLVKKLTKKQLQNAQGAIAAEFQQAAVDVLVTKTLKAAKKYCVKTVLLGGGVAANSYLREEMRKKFLILNSKFLIPPKALCTDNAAMIGLAAAYRLAANKTKPWSKIHARADLEL